MKKNLPEHIQKAIEDKRLSKDAKELFCLCHGKLLVKKNTKESKFFPAIQQLKKYGYFTFDADR